jgi:hypothetical protein
LTTASSVWALHFSDYEIDEVNEHDELNEPCNSLLSTCIKLCKIHIIYFAYRRYSWDCPFQTLPSQHFVGLNKITSHSKNIVKQDLEEENVKTPTNATAY